MTDLQGLARKIDSSGGTQEPLCIEVPAVLGQDGKALFSKGDSVQGSDAGYVRYLDELIGPLPYRVVQITKWRGFEEAWGGVRVLLQSSSKETAWVNPSNLMKVES